MKNIGDFYLKNFSFLEIKFSIYLNRCVFVMWKNVAYMRFLFFYTKFCLLILRGRIYLVESSTIFDKGWVGAQLL